MVLNDDIFYYLWLHILMEVHSLTAVFLIICTTPYSHVIPRTLYHIG